MRWIGAAAVLAAALTWIAQPDPRVRARQHRAELEKPDADWGDLSQPYPEIRINMSDFGSPFFGEPTPPEPLPPVTLVPISGRVVDGDGKGIEFIRILLDPENAPKRWQEYDDALRGVSTDREGAFEFPKVPEGAYSVIAVLETTDRALRFSRSGVPAGSRDVAITIPQRPYPMPIRLRYSVLRPDGSPLPKGKMRMYGFGIDAFIENGKASMDHYGERPAPGRRKFMLRIWPEGDDAGGHEIWIDIRKEFHEIRLSPPCRLTGRVTLDGRPLASKVQAIGVGRTPGRYATRSGEDGRFEFRRLPSGDVWILLDDSTSLYRVANPEQIVPSDAEGIEVRAVRAIDMPFELIPPPGIRLGKLEIECRPSAPGDFRWRTAHDAAVDGTRFEVPSLTPGSTCELYVWGALTDGTRFRPAVFSFEATTELRRIQLQRGGSVTGRVVRRDGTPIKDIWVYAEHPVPHRWMQHQPKFHEHGVTDEQGRFRLTGIPESGCYLDALGTDMEKIGAPPLARDGDKVEIVMEPPSWIEGRVVDPFGRGFHGMTIESFDSDPKAVRDGWLLGHGLGGDGNFTIDVPAGRSALYVWANDWRNAAREDDRYAFAIVEAGAKDIRLELREGKRVTGRTVREDGTPVFSQLRIEGAWGFRRYWSDSDGSFTFYGVPPGACTVEAVLMRDATRELASQSLHIQAGGPPVRLVLRVPDESRD